MLLESTEEKRITSVYHPMFLCLFRECSSRTVKLFFKLLAKSSGLPQIAKKFVTIAFLSNLCVCLELERLSVTRADPTLGIQVLRQHQCEYGPENMGSSKFLMIVYFLYNQFPL